MGGCVGSIRAEKEEPLARDGLFSKTDVDEFFAFFCNAPMNADFFSSLVFATVAPSRSSSAAWQSRDMV